VELTWGGAAPMRAATEEISLGGCYIETMFTMEPGTKLSIALSLRDHVVHCVGIVATRYPQVGNGIEFVDMAPQDRLQLSRYIESIDG
jgi:c-di-GMP-binding flagellar brake protein YcgR